MVKADSPKPHPHSTREKEAILGFFFSDTDTESLLLKFDWYNFGSDLGHGVCS